MCDSVILLYILLWNLIVSLKVIMSLDKIYELYGLMTWNLIGNQIPPRRWKCNKESLMKANLFRVV